MNQRAQIITDVAGRVGTDPRWLDALINFETAGTYSPTIENRSDPEAKGLIQFRDEAAQDLGFRDSTDLVQTLGTFHNQMYGAVLPYLEMRKKRYGPLDTQNALYMAVFYPRYINEPPDTLFPEHVRKANPGIDTPADYIAHVNRRIRTEALNFPKVLIPPTVAVGGALVIFLYLRRRRK